MARKPVRKQTALVAARATKPTAPRQLLGELRQLIDDARTQVAQVVNSGLSLLYWRIGERIRREILQSKRAEYGERVISQLSHGLTKEYGRGFSPSSLARMVKFSE